MAGELAAATALSHHVAHVVGLGADPKVLGVHAWRVVAPMKHEHPHGDRAVVVFPRDTVRCAHTIGEANLPVSIVCAGSREFPASRGRGCDLVGDDRPRFPTLPQRSQGFAHVLSALSPLTVARAKSASWVGGSVASVLCTHGDNHTKAVVP